MKNFVSSVSSIYSSPKTISNKSKNSSSSHHNKILPNMNNNTLELFHLKKDDISNSIDMSLDVKIKSDALKKQLEQEDEEFKKLKANLSPSQHNEINTKLSEDNLSIHSNSFAESIELEPYLDKCNNKQSQ